MTEQERARLDKAKLLEWLDVEIDLSEGSDPVLRADRWAFRHVKKEIESGSFDISLDREEQLIKEVAELKEYIEGLIGPERTNANRLLIAENEQLKNSVRYWQEDAKRSDEHASRIAGKVAEQDKEIQAILQYVKDMKKVLREELNYAKREKQDVWADHIREKMQIQTDLIEKMESGYFK